MTGSIDPESDRPKFRQLADILREQIISGRLPGGAALPSKQQLADEHAVSINTVEGALRELKAAGLIIMERGRHTRVRPVRVHSSDRYEAGKANYNPDQESRFAREHGVPFSQFDLTREYHTIPAPARVAEALGLAEGAPVVERRWIHAVDGVRLRVSWSYLDAAKFGPTILCNPDEPPWPGGTIAQLRALGHDVSRVPTVVRARPGTEAECALLELEPGSQVLESWRIQMTVGAVFGSWRAVECALHVYPAQSAALEFVVPVTGRDWTHHEGG